MPLSADGARLLAQRIARGHAWREHRAEFPDVVGAASFAAVIESILVAPDFERTLARGRAAYWHNESGTIVVSSRNDRDGGTCFRPVEGKPYFDSVE